jgi:hypothetical protein
MLSSFLPLTQIVGFHLDTLEIGHIIRYNIASLKFYRKDN